MRVRADLRMHLVGLVCAALIGACSGEGEGDTVEMQGHAYSPETLTVAVGDTVRWTNSSDESHTVTAYEDRLPENAEFFATGGATSEQEARDSLIEGLLGQGEEFIYTFEVRGTYEYFCIPHEADGMTATVIVERS